MRIIFLDIDGVLNNPGCYNTPSGKASGSHTPPAPHAIKALNYITDSTNAVIVVSSSWRMLFNRVAGLRDLFNQWGVTGAVLDRTPRPIGTSQSTEPRGQEIDAWLRTHREYRTINSFVILDDESDMHPHQARLVQTNGAIGLTMEDADKAITILRKHISW